MKPGEIITQTGSIELNKARPTKMISVVNTGDRPIQVGSHFHFFEVNKALEFDRRNAFGMRLDIPSGTAVRFEPGEEKTVKLTAIGGLRRGFGLNSLTNGSFDDEKVREAAFKTAKQKGFKGV